MLGLKFQTLKLSKTVMEKIPIFFLSISWRCLLIPETSKHMDFYHHNDQPAIWFKEIDIYNIEYFKELVPFSPATAVCEIFNFQAITASL